MPTLHLNGCAVEAADGATILDSARTAGIEIPTFCWYPKLPTVGNCRIRVVSVEGSAPLLPVCHPGYRVEMGHHRVTRFGSQVEVVEQA